MNILIQKALKYLRNPHLLPVALTAKIMNVNTLPDVAIPKPESLDLLLELLRKLSDKKMHFRVDFYSIGRRLYFGELTFYHAGGYIRFEPQE